MEYIKPLDARARETYNEVVKTDISALTIQKDEKEGFEMNSLFEEIKAKTQGDGLLHGTAIQMGEIAVPELYGRVGMEFLWMDTEHSSLGKREMLPLIISAKAGGLYSFVRIPWNDPVLAKPILDMSPDGIIIPYITCLEDAKEAVKAVCYPPKGVRGTVPARATAYGALGMAEYVERDNNNFLLMLQVEHPGCVADLEEICAIPEVNALMVGPMDLAMTMGKHGNTRDPEVMAAMDHIAEAVHASGKLLGVSIGSDEQNITDWVRRKVDLLTTGCDNAYLARAAMQDRELVSRVREKLAQK